MVPQGKTTLKKPTNDHLHRDQMYYFPPKKLLFHLHYFAFSNFPFFHKMRLSPQGCFDNVTFWDGRQRGVQVCFMNGILSVPLQVAIY